MSIVAARRPAWCLGSRRYRGLELARRRDTTEIPEREQADGNLTSACDISATNFRTYLFALLYTRLPEAQPQPGGGADFVQHSPLTVLQYTSLLCRPRTCSYAPRASWVGRRECGSRHLGSKALHEYTRSCEFHTGTAIVRVQKTAQTKAQKVGLSLSVKSIF